MSKGEEKIITILKKEKISFKREVIVPFLNGKKKVPLRYDFGIYIGKILCALIEVDGIQHFKYIPKFYKNQSDFRYRRGCDRKKNDWALKNNIPLYRIPYWELENINNFKDIISSKFLVKNIYHNDIIIRENFGGI